MAFPANGVPSSGTSNSQENLAAIDLKELVDEVRERGIGLPLLIRFPEILKSRIVDLNEAFRTAITEYGYRGVYRGVYPIKVNQDRYVVEQACRLLENAAGNFYINDKPTGAVVGQQPFGGARASGTNDKAGSYLNLLRWVSPRTIKETFVPPTDYRYPFLLPD